MTKFMFRRMSEPQPKSRLQSRVATDLENLEKSGNLKETSESGAICLKSQGICDRIPKVREFCCLEFIFSQVEDPHFENFLGEQTPTGSQPPHPLNGLGLTVELNLGSGKVKEKSGNFILYESGNPGSLTLTISLILNTDRFGGLKLFISSALNLLKESIDLREGPNLFHSRRQ